MSTLAVDSITDAVGSGAPAFPNGVSGNIVSTGALTATGIYLGGTGSANLLDDYEEGTWTPAFVSGQEPDGTVSSLAGQYVKVGKLVTVYMQVDGSSLNLTDYVRVEGLPFAASASNATGTYLLGGITDRNHGWTVLASGTTQWYWSTSGSDSETSIVASVTYRTA